MTRMTGPDCVVMCNLINTHTHTHTQQVSLIPPWEDQREWHRMTRMTGPHCAVMCNLINTHTHTHTKKPQNSCTRRAGNGEDMGGNGDKCRKGRVCSEAADPDNLGSNKEAEGGAQGAQGSSKICTSRESVSPLSRLIRGIRNKYH